jgi:hypothetical protein
MNGNEPSCSIKGVEFLASRDEYQLLNKLLLVNVIVIETCLSLSPKGPFHTGC